MGEETCQERPERQGCALDQKHGQSFYGYKSHIGVDKLHKIIRKWVATDASPHDSQKLNDILDASNTGSQVWADSAYRSAEIEPSWLPRA